MSKTPKRGNHKRSSKQLPETTQRKNLAKKKDATTDRTPWLQILSEELEGEQASGAGRNPLPKRNGRRTVPEMNLYVAERNLRGTRKFR